MRAYLFPLKKYASRPLLSFAGFGKTASTLSNLACFKEGQLTMSLGPSTMESSVEPIHTSQHYRTNDTLTGETHTKLDFDACVPTPIEEISLFLFIIGIE